MLQTSTADEKDIRVGLVGVVAAEPAPELEPVLAIASVSDEWLLLAVSAATAEVVVEYIQINRLEIVKKLSLGDHESTESPVPLPIADMIIVLHWCKCMLGSRRNQHIAAVVLTGAVAAVGS